MDLSITTPCEEDYIMSVIKHGGNTSTVPISTKLEVWGDTLYWSI